jgi:hypothetical protein
MSETRARFPPMNSALLCLLRDLDGAPAGEDAAVNRIIEILGRRPEGRTRLVSAMAQVVDRQVKGGGACRKITPDSASRSYEKPTGTTTCSIKGLARDYPGGWRDYLRHLIARCGAGDVGTRYPFRRTYRVVPGGAPLGPLALLLPPPRPLAQVARSAVGSRGSRAARAAPPICG